MGKKLVMAVSIAAILALAACSEAPQTTATPETQVQKEPPKPTGPVDAQTAFYEMYKPARTWAPDLLPLTLGSGDAPGIKQEDGKFGKWTAVFVSPSRREARTFTYTVGQGVAAGEEESWSGATPNSRPFQLIEFTVNSDAAYQTALKQAQSWVKSHPGKEPAFSLFNASRYPAPVWYILWGTKSNGYGVIVNAMTGAVVKGK